VYVGNASELAARLREYADSGGGDAPVYVCIAGNGRLTHAQQDLMDSVVWLVDHIHPNVGEFVVLTAHPDTGDAGPQLQLEPEP